MARAAVIDAHWDEERRDFGAYVRGFGANLFHDLPRVLSGFRAQTLVRDDHQFLRVAV